MASFVFYPMSEQLAEGAIDFDTDTFRIALVTSSYTLDQTDVYWSEIQANEVSGTGYTAGGETSACTVSRVSGVTTLADVTWTAPVSGFTAAYAVIYKDTGTAATSPLVALVDPGTPVAANGSSFTVEITSDITITTPAG